MCFIYCELAQELNTRNAWIQALSGPPGQKDLQSSQEEMPTHQLCRQSTDAKDKLLDTLPDTNKQAGPSLGEPDRGVYISLRDMSTKYVRWETTLSLPKYQELNVAPGSPSWHRPSRSHETTKRSINARRQPLLMRSLTSYPLYKTICCQNKVHVLHKYILLITDMPDTLVSKYLNLNSYSTHDTELQVTQTQQWKHTKIKEKVDIHCVHSNPTWHQHMGVETYPHPYTTLLTSIIILLKNSVKQHPCFLGS